MASCQVRAAAVPFAAWIIRVAHNVGVDHMRHAARHPLRGGARVPTTEATTSPQNRSTSCRRRSPRCPDEQREVVVLRHVVGLTPGEIANCIGPDRDSMHGLHHRGRGALQAELSSRESAPSTAPSRPRHDSDAFGSRRRRAGGPVRAPRPRRPGAARGAARGSAARGRGERLHLGHHVEAFEPEFATYCETESRHRRGSGTDALALALRALGVGLGDEVDRPGQHVHRDRGGGQPRGRPAAARRSSTRRRACSRRNASKPHSPRAAVRASRCICTARRSTWTRSWSSPARPASP